MSRNPFRAYAQWIETPRVRARDAQSWAQPWILIPAAGGALLLCAAGVGLAMSPPVLVRVAGALVLLVGLVWTAVLIGYFLRPPTKV